MTYRSNEVGIESGRPIHLYEFKIPDPNDPNSYLSFYGYTDNESDLTVNGRLYRAVPMYHSRIENGELNSRTSLSISCAYDLDIVSELSSQIAGRVYRFAIREFHQGSSSDSIVLSTGIVSSVNLSVSSGDFPQCVISCKTLLSLVNRNLFSQVISKRCNYMLFGPGCNAPREKFLATGQVNGTPDELTNTIRIRNIINVPYIDPVTMQAFEPRRPYADHWFSGGTLETIPPSGGKVVRRNIHSHLGDAFIVFPTIGGQIKADDNIQLVAGCDRTIKTCNEKFVNRLNFGGMPNLVKQNTYDIITYTET